MNENIERTRSLLLELRSAVKRMGADPSEITLRKLMDQYDVLFGGKQFNRIDSEELRYALADIHGISIPQDDFNALLPLLCGELGMVLEAMILLTDAGKKNPPINRFLITLF